MALPPRELSASFVAHLLLKLALKAVELLRHLTSLRPHHPPLCLPSGQRSPLLGQRYHLSTPPSTRDSSHNNDIMSWRYQLQIALGHHLELLTDTLCVQLDGHSP